jgi:hypothetical protein
MAESPFDPAKSENPINTNPKPPTGGSDSPTPTDITPDPSPSTPPTSTPTPVVNRPAPGEEKGDLAPPPTTVPPDPPTLPIDPPQEKPMVLPSAQPTAPSDDPPGESAPADPTPVPKPETSSLTPSGVSSALQPNLPPSEAVPVEPSKGEEMGPPWLRTDPKVREAQDGTGSQAPNLSPTPSEPAPPWQVPSERSTKTAPQIFTADQEKHGGFPVIIFVVLILAIIAALGVYLFLGL